MSIVEINYCKICNIETSLKCSRCKSIYYCSIEHQKIDWSIHKCECKDFVEIYNSKKEFRRNTRSKLRESFYELNFSEDVIDSALYLLNLSMHDETQGENRKTFMQNEEIINNIKEIAINLDSLNKMQNIINGFYCFNLKYPGLTNIILDSCLLNYIWNNINGWMS